MFSALLAIGLASCGDDKNQSPSDQPAAEDTTPQSSTAPCKGDECTAKQTEAETKMAACDFAAAYEALDTVYAAQISDNKIDAQTALDRSVLGLIHLLYREDVQKLLPKLGFIANSGLVDFKPLWEGNNGLFKQIFTGNHDYEGFADRMPMTIAKDDDKSWKDTIDKSITFDNVLDVLVSLKPELESLASSLEEAAKLTGSNAISPNEKIGCGLNNFKVDAADLNAMAALLMAADAAIDLLSHYDFDFSIRDTLNPPDGEISVYIPHCRVFFDENGEIVKDECKSMYDIDYHDWECEEFEGWNEDETIQLCRKPVEIIPFTESCSVELDDKKTPVEDSCKEKYSVDYTTLFCGERGDEEDPYLECAIPGKSDDYKAFEKYANMLIPHLFMPTASPRKVTGATGSAAFQKAASLFLSALNGSAKGAFFDFSKIPSGALNDMKDIAKAMADGSGDLSKFIKPGLKADLKKVFDDVLYAQKGDMQIDVTGDEVDLSGKYWIGDFVQAVYGDEVFLNEKLPNHILNTSLISHDTYYGEGIDYIELEFMTDRKYDATFSSEWENLPLGSWLNPHEYFGQICSEGDECPEKCPDPQSPYFYRDSSSPNGFICSACWDKCEGDTPYCVYNIFEKRSYCIDKPECPAGTQAYAIEFPNPETDEWIKFASCMEMDGMEAYEYCRDDNGDAPNGVYVHYDKAADSYVCSHCDKTCSGETPYCVPQEPDYEYSNYICAAVESCPENTQFASNGQCMPKDDSPCPDELKTKDICITEKDGDYSESTLYYCNTEGKVSIINRYETECKEVDVSTYGTDLKTISVLVELRPDASPMPPECDESGIQTECVYTLDDKEAVSGYACTKATDGTPVTINLASRGIYLQVCTEAQFCGHSDELGKATCMEPEPEPEPVEPEPEPEPIEPEPEA